MAERLVTAQFRKNDDVHAEPLGFVHGHHADDARRFIFLQRVMLQIIAKAPPVIVGFSFGVEFGGGINERHDFRRGDPRRFVHPVTDGGRQTMLAGGSQSVRAKEGNARITAQDSERRREKVRLRYSVNRRGHTSHG